MNTFIYKIINAEKGRWNQATLRAKIIALDKCEYRTHLGSHDGQPLQHQSDEIEIEFGIAQSAAFGSDFWRYAPSTHWNV